MIATIKPRFVRNNGYGYPMKPGVVVVKETLVGAICKAFDVLPQDLTGKTRDVALVYPRHFFRYVLKNFTNYTLANIAELSGCRQHATIKHSVRTAENLMSTDAIYRAKCNRVLTKIANNQILMPKRKCQY